MESTWCAYSTLLLMTVGVILRTARNLGTAPSTSPAFLTTGEYDASKWMPLTDFELAQLARSDCASIVRNTSSWAHPVLMDRNVFFVWVGSDPIPDRGIYGMASAAMAYGASWTLTVLTTTPMSDVTTRIMDVLQADACTGGASRIENHVVNLADLLSQVGWPQEKVQIAQAIFNKGGRDNIVTVSDIIRVVAVHLKGGVYLDMDTIVLEPIHRPMIAVNCNDFFCYSNPAGVRLQEGLSPEQPVTCMANGIFAFPRGHPILRQYLEQMALHLGFDQWAVVGPHLFLKTIDWAHTWHPHLLSNVFALSVKCLLCAWNEAHDYCTNYTYLTHGSTDGDLPDLAKEMYAKSVARHCFEVDAVE